WVGYLSDKVLVATSDRVVALDPATGAEHWRFTRAGASRGKTAADPFARGEPTSTDSAGARWALHEFQVVGGRLFCLRGEHELIAIDGETGAHEWSFSAAGGSISSKVWIGPDRSVFEVQNPNHLVVLETESGRQVARTPLGEGESLERAPVPIDEDHVLIVPDRRTVKKYELSRGQFTCSYSESSDMPVNGSPRVIAGADRILVLHDGRVLLRLDPVDGSRRWSTVLGIEDLSDRIGAIACDDHRVYCASQQLLRALSLEDGSS